MPLPELLPRATDFLRVPAPNHCVTAGRWGIDPVLVLKLWEVSRNLGEFRISILSGARDQAAQEALEAAGRPAAPFDRSTHADRDSEGCFRLATGVDILTDIAPVGAVKARLGAVAVTNAGLRWGGGSPIGSDGIPEDWNHLDLGPR